MISTAENLMLVKDIMPAPVYSVTLKHTVSQLLKLIKEKISLGFR